MLRGIFYAQIAFAVVCDSSAFVVKFFVRPFDNFDSEQANLEKLISQKGHFLDPSLMNAIHYFTTTLYNGWQVIFCILQITCIWLIVGGIMGIRELSRAHSQTH